MVRCFIACNERLLLTNFICIANREKRCRLAKNNRVTQAPSTITANKSLTSQPVTCKEGKVIQFKLILIFYDQKSF